MEEEDEIDKILFTQYNNLSSIDDVNNFILFAEENISLLKQQLTHNIAQSKKFSIESKIFKISSFIVLGVSKINNDSTTLIKFHELISHFHYRIKIGLITCLKLISLDEFLEISKANTFNFINVNLKVYLHMKVILNLQIVFVKNEDREIRHFLNKANLILISTNLDEWWKKESEKFKEKVKVINEKGSNWVFDQILHLEIVLCKVSLLKGGCYIPLPTKLKNTRAITNIKDNDNTCFPNAIMIYLKRKKESLLNRKEDYMENYLDRLDFKNIDLPMKIIDIPRFERKKKTN